MTRDNTERERRSLSKLGAWTLATVATALIGSLASFLVPSLLNGSSSKSAATSVRIFNPVTAGRLNPRLKIVQRDRGKCITGAESDPGNPDTFRCFGRLSIYDPCFLSSGSQMVCLSVPWESRAALVTDTDAVTGTGRPLDKKMPWAIELSNGQACGLVGGATEVVAGLRENYMCDGKSGGIAYGWPDERQKLWTIAYGGASSEALTEVGIKVAWY
ncbi:MAG: hypothetical protein ACXVY8_01445 [Gaiellaceae bacterium]